MGEKEINRARRLNRPITVALLDLDNFKIINDRCGHLAGDNVIQFISSLCRNNLREIDIIGRFGGDELMVMMPDTDLKAARTPLERLRTAIETTPIVFKEEDIHVTVSIGVVSADQDIPDLEYLVKNTDDSMYMAKKNGKNCIFEYQQSKETKGK